MSESSEEGDVTGASNKPTTLTKAQVDGTTATTINVTSSANLPQGTYKMYVGDATTTTYSVSVSDNTTQSLAFTGTSGVEANTEIYVTFTASGKSESEKSEKLTVVAA